MIELKKLRNILYFIKSQRYKEDTLSNALNILMNDGECGMIFNEYEKLVIDLLSNSLSNGNKDNTFKNWFYTLDVVGIKSRTLEEIYNYYKNKYWNGDVL